MNFKQFYKHESPDVHKVAVGPDTRAKLVKRMSDHLQHTQDADLGKLFGRNDKTTPSKRAISTVDAKTGRGWMRRVTEPWDGGRGRDTGRPETAAEALALAMRGVAALREKAQRANAIVIEEDE